MDQIAPLLPQMRWHHLYLALVFLDVASAGTGLWLNHRIAEEHHQSVRASMAWSAITADLDDIANTAAAIAIAIPSFADDSDPQALHAGLNRRLAEVNARLRTGSAAVSRGLGAAAIDRLDGAANRLWLASSQVDEPIAPRRRTALAAMELARELAVARADARTTHDRELTVRSQRIGELRGWFHGLIAFAVITTTVMATYGMRLIGRFRRQERQAGGFLAALEASELRKATVISGALDAIIVMNQFGNVTDFNPAAERIFGISAAQMAGRPVIDVLIPVVGRETYRRAIARFRATGDGRLLGRRMETTALRVDGSEFPVELTITSALVVGQALFTVHIRDITERKEQETALRHSNRELEQFAYIVSHDLQEPLRMVSGYLALLKKRHHQALDAKGRDFISQAVDGAERMHALINGLLAYSRVGRAEAPQEPVAAHTALTEAIANLRPQLSEAGAEVTYDALPVVLGDRMQLVQLFQNLVGNAVKYRGPAAPQVHITAARDGEHWRISVRDNGIGIDPAHHERIFEVFQRLHTRSEYPGTGIGLAICKKIVERHGGRLWVESMKGAGSSFAFTLPAAGDGKLHLLRDRKSESSATLRILPQSPAEPGAEKTPGGGPVAATAPETTAAAPV